MAGAAISLAPLVNSLRSPGSSLFNERMASFRPVISMEADAVIFCSLLSVVYSKFQ
jgi:hypothetical protein